MISQISNLHVSKIGGDGEIEAKSQVKSYTHSRNRLLQSNTQKVEESASNVSISRNRMQFEDESDRFTGVRDYNKYERRSGSNVDESGQGLQADYSRLSRNPENESIRSNKVNTFRESIANQSNPSLASRNKDIQDYEIDRSPNPSRHPRQNQAMSRTPFLDNSNNNIGDQNRTEIYESKDRTVMIEDSLSYLDQKSGFIPSQINRRSNTNFEPSELTEYNMSRNSQMKPRESAPPTRLDNRSNSRSKYSYSNNPALKWWTVSDNLR